MGQESNQSEKVKALRNDDGEEPGTSPESHEEKTPTWTRSYSTQEISKLQQE